LSTHDCRIAWLEHDRAASAGRNPVADPDLAQNITMKKGAFSTLNCGATSGFDGIATALQALGKQLEMRVI